MRVKFLITANHFTFCIVISPSEQHVFVYEVETDNVTAYLKDFNYVRDFQSTGYQQAQDEVRKIISQVLNVKAVLQLLKPELKGELLFSHDKALLNEYFNDLIKYNGFISAHREILKRFKDNQIRMINFFKNKYHLE